MPTLPAFQELYDAAKAEIQLRRSDLTDFVEGSVLDAITGAAAVLADEVIRVGVEGFAELFFDTAEGSALDALAQDRFGIERNAATAAVGEVEWTRGTAGAYTILAGTRFRATVGTETITVQSTAAVSVLVSDTTVTIPVEATTTGRATNAAADTVTEVVDTVVADPTATVTNPEPLAGGTDAETDEAFRARIRRLYSTLRRGTKAALETGALEVDGVTIVRVDESLAAAGGAVQVIIGDPDGNGNSTLVDDVTTELENWRAAGVLVTVLAAEREVVPIALTIYVEQGADQTAVGAACRAAIEAYGDSIVPGVSAQRSRIEQACHDASELVVGVDFDTLALELEPSADNKAIRFEGDSITITWQQVA